MAREIAGLGRMLFVVRFRRAVRRLRRCRAGVTTIEMAILLPVFLAFLLGICEFARALWTQTALQFAVEAAARCAAISPSLCTASGGSTTDVPGYAATQVWALSIPSTAFTYTPNATCVAAASTGAQVTASYAFAPVLNLASLLTTAGASGGSNLLNVTLSAKSCHP